MLRRLFQASRPALLLVASALPAVAAEGVGPAQVVGVHPTRVADLILLDAGFDAGFRPGMVCRVVRSGLEVAEVLLVELRPSYSAALIVSLAPRQAIRVGDSARIKLLKS